MVAEAVMDYLLMTVKLSSRDSLTLAPLGFNVNCDQGAAPVPRRSIDAICFQRFTRFTDVGTAWFQRQEA
jgi:hypothetical protein